MRADIIIRKIIERLSLSDELSSTKIYSSYQARPMPSRIKDNYILIGVDKINSTSYSMDNENKYYDISISVRIYTPPDEDKNIAYELLATSCLELQDFNISSISADEVICSSESNSYFLNSTISFLSDECFGGECLENEV